MPRACPGFICHMASSCRLARPATSRVFQGSPAHLRHVCLKARPPSSRVSHGPPTYVTCVPRPALHPSRSLNKQVSVISRGASLVRRQCLDVIFMSVGINRSANGEEYLRQNGRLMNGGCRGGRLRDNDDLLSRLTPCLLACTSCIKGPACLLVCTGCKKSFRLPACLN